MQTFKKLVGISIVLISLGFSGILSTIFAQRVELKNRRTLFSTTYRNPDNSLTTEISAAPMHHWDEKGNLQPLNRTIVQSNSEYDYEVTQGFYHAYFNTDLQSEYPVVFETKDGANLKMKLLAVAYLDITSKDYYTFQEIQPNTPIVSGNQILFPNVFDNIDVKYIYCDTRLKEEIWVTRSARDNLPDPSQFGINPQNAYLVFVTQLDLDGAPMVCANQKKIRHTVFEGHEKINFRNIKGDVKFFIPVDWAFRDVDRDSLSEESMLKIRKRLIHENGKHLLLSGVKLKDLSRILPGTVVFDPQIQLELQPDSSEGYDTRIVYKNNYNNHLYNYGISNLLAAGRTKWISYDIIRSLLRFDLSEIPDNATIVSAAFELYCYYTHTSSSTILDLHKMLTDWDEGNKDGTEGQASWNKPTPTGSWGTGGGQAGVDYSSSDYATITKDSSNVDEWFEWTITDLVQEWVSQQSPNKGLIIKYRNDHQPVSGNHRKFLFRSSDYTEADTLRPKLEVTYTEDFTTTYYIRDASGNVIATYRK